MSVDDVTKIAAAYDRFLGEYRQPLERGSLLVLVGLPASGKSLLAEAVTRRLPALLVSTDAARKHLGHSPTYSEREMARVYQACHQVIESRLRERQRVVFDASNHRRDLRRLAYQRAEVVGARLAVCEVRIPAETALERLKARHSQARRASDLSDASWNVYQWMAQRYEPVGGAGLQLDASRESPERLASRVIAYWRSIEVGRQ